MRLADNRGSSFELALDGYQFPDAHGTLDPNWLLIRIHVQSGQEEWTATAPALLTIEVSALVDWLNELGNARPADREVDFTEPNLSFELVERTDEDVRMRIWFELEFRPGERRGRGDIERDLCLDLRVTRNVITAAAKDLRSQLYAFPTRVPLG